MKLFIILIIALSLFGCSSKIIVKDCNNIGQNIYECEQI